VGIQDVQIGKPLGAYTHVLQYYGHSRQVLLLKLVTTKKPALHLVHIV